MSPDVGGVETKGFLAATKAASEPELLEKELAGYRHGLSNKVEGIESSRVGVVGNGGADPGYQCVSLYDRAKHRIACFLLSPNVHFLSNFLVDEGKGDIGGFLDGTVRR